ncbi:hypothetical protein [Natronosalvus halobius]|uniref:hypothetical protein n=1 Tax=Natronosalvus halobius TaxID=2953746 RepID=UPI0020A07D7A|nr:hypothetical protein [Natronosalvus halobius]USZ71175.1 hypothetical protein NGM15_13955 [Natronosalvus halobius]
MNHLVPASDAENRWHLPNHAHLVVYERGSGERGLLTIYDCGAAQKPPSAQLLGTLEAVDVRAETEATPTGRVVSLREPSVLEALDGDRYRIRQR